MGNNLSILMLCVKYGYHKMQYLVRLMAALSVRNVCFGDKLFKPPSLFILMCITFCNSCENVKHKQSSKKSCKKAVTERDFYKKNYFHACESLLSLMIDKRRNGKTAVLWLKKSGPEVPEILTQFSASIAGTGLAVLLSVILKVACGRVPLCASKVLNTGVGFGLVWLSWAVNRLRDTIVSISKNSAKLNSKEEEIIRTVDKSVNEIFFRAATLMAVAVLRFA